MAKNISIYSGVSDTKSKEIIPIDIFFDRIREGYWQDPILELMNEKDAKRREQLKKRLPCVTVTGSFSERNDKSILEYSGYISLDVDKLTPDEIQRYKDKLRRDKFVAACFVSCSGNGLCIVCRIKKDNFEDSFLYLSKYFQIEHNIVVDASCSNLSRLRFVSYDPGIIVNDTATVFSKHYDGPAPKKIAYKEKKVVHVQSDFDMVLDQIDQNGVDIAPGYLEWRDIGFAIADKYGEGGREAFHIISRPGASYIQSVCDRQYTNLLKAGKDGITISSFYYYAKLAGLKIVSEKVSEITTWAANRKRAACKKDEAIKDILDPNSGVSTDKELVNDIVTQVYDNNIQVADASDMEAARIYIQNLKLIKNEVTGMLEREDGSDITNSMLADIELDMKEKMQIPYEDTKRLLISNRIPSYHPIKSFFSKNLHLKGEGNIRALADSISSPTGEGHDYVFKMLQRWLVGAVGCVYGNYSHMMLILCSEKPGTGKTYFFEHILPPSIGNKYWAKKNFSALETEGGTKDLQILLSKNWLVFDDEMGGKSKRDHGKIKELLSQSTSTERAAYDRLHEKRNRLCFFGGTCNDMEIIPENEGNRRYVPIEVKHINKNAINAVDRDELWMEAYRLYQDKFQFQILDQDIEELKEHTRRFAEVSFEQEMLTKYFKKPERWDDPRGDSMTCTDIQNAIATHTHEKLSRIKLLRAIKAMCGSAESTDRKGNNGKYYYIVKTNNDFIQFPKS
jgi:predicted P-loop ATPase